MIHDELIVGRRFVAGLTANLQQDGFPAEVVASVGMTCHPVDFGKTNSRSVLGSQNDLIHLGKIWADGWDMETEEGILGLNHKLNRVPMSYLKEFYAVKEMRIALGGWRP